MKTYKLLQLLLIGCVVWSCSKDSMDSSAPEDLNSNISLDQYDNSYLGLYKGVFTTEDGLTRGSVVMTLSPDNTALAELTLSSGERIELASETITLTVDNKVSNLRFSSEGRNALISSFDFSVEGDGQNPVVTDVTFDSKASDILIAKNTQRLPLTPITGTYVCTNCSANGTGFPTNNRTWNVMSIGTGNNQNFMAQVAYGGRVYTSPAGNNVQNNCSVTGAFTTCDIAGSIRILGHDVTWSGTHTYSTSENQTACSAVSGTWSAPTYGPGAMGTFVSDSDCSDAGVANDICENAISIAIGSSVSGSTVNATMTDAPPTCVVDLDTSPGVWYTFVGNGFPAVINTDGSALDTKVGYFTGTCGALICENGDDNGGLNSASFMPLNTVLNEVYYIYVTGADTETGDFILNIEGPSSTTEANCGESFQDHAGNGNYGANRSDVYTIDAGEGNTINIFFSEFDTEEGFDFLRIYDGPDTSSLVISRTVEGTPADSQGFSGTGVDGINSLLEENIVSSGRYLTLVFNTDNNVVHTGFTGEVTCVAGRQPMGLQETTRTFNPPIRVMPIK